MISKAGMKSLRLSFGSLPTLRSPVRRTNVGALVTSVQGGGSESEIEVWFRSRTSPCHLTDGQLLFPANRAGGESQPRFIDPFQRPQTYLSLVSQDSKMDSVGQCSQASALSSGSP